jgi:iron complex transport system ATP-binding protein
MTNPLLAIHQLSAGYPTRTVLSNFSLALQPGEILALIGPNGAGKTTLLKALTGIVAVHTGSIRLMGEEMLHLSWTERARRVAVVPQARQLPEGFDVFDTVLMGRTPYLGLLGRPSESDYARTRWALERTDTLRLSERRLEALSGGEQQRVLLARALAQDTPLLLLDEPTAHLDLHHQANILNLLRELVSERVLGVLLVLHDLNLAALYAHRVALMVDGKLQALGAPADVLTPEHLLESYQSDLHVFTHPVYGTPVILPNGRH